MSAVYNPMNGKLESRRIVIYLAISFGIAWATFLIIYLMGGLENSPEIVDGSGIPWALVLLAGPVMWSPALAHILTRWITREGWQDLYLRPRFQRSWIYWLVAWLVPGILTILGIVVYFLLFPQNYDPSLQVLREMLAASPAADTELAQLNVWTIVILQIVQALLLAPLINGVATFGEEFGWRAYLQPKLMPLGARRTMLLMGLIWGVWHWPAILMGHNYGLDYPGAPWLGPLAMVWFTLVLGIFLGWLTLKSGNVWPAVIGHGAINGIASLGILFAQGDPNPLIGPMPTGVLAGLGFSILALWLLFGTRELAKFAPTDERNTSST